MNTFKVARTPCDAQAAFLAAKLPLAGNDLHEINSQEEVAAQIAAEPAAVEESAEQALEKALNVINAA